MQLKGDRTRLLAGLRHRLCGKVGLDAALGVNHDEAD